jgi:hypothetical protein
MPPANSHCQWPNVTRENAATSRSGAEPFTDPHASHARLTERFGNRSRTCSREILSKETWILMKSLMFALCGVFVLGSLAARGGSWQPSPGHTQLTIWPGAAPDSQPVRGPEVVEPSGNKFMVAGRQVIGVSNVTRPTMTVYSPKGKNTGVAVIVFPGGGYQTLAIDLEGTEACDWLTSKGITCVLLKYRVTDVGPYPKVWAISGIADGAGRCAENHGAGAFARGRKAHRSAQGRSARVFSRRASCGSDQQPL